LILRPIFHLARFGFAAQPPKSAIASYLQVDLRLGLNIQALGFIDGLRYRFYIGNMLPP
jgi:hypothetical protein